MAVATCTQCEGVLNRRSLSLHRARPKVTPYPVAHAQLQVSFNNGTSWQPAALARTCHGQVCTNRFRATYTAPAAAQVSLRVTARDTHGASVTETILGAYQTV